MREPSARASVEPPDAGGDGAPNADRRHARHRDAWASLCAWRAERLPWTRFAALALAVAWIASLGQPFVPSAAVGRFVLAFTLVVQFRLWDDLVDRERDRTRHPERVMTRSVDLGAFVLACVGLGAGNVLALLVLHGAAAATGLALLSAVLGAWYRLHPGRGIIHAHVLLLKYPLFAFVLSGEATESWARIPAAAALYSGLCLFEFLDGQAGQPLPSKLLGLHGSVITLAACWPRLDTAGGAAGVLAASLCIAVIAHERLRLPGWKYWPLAAAIIVLVRSSLGDSA